MSFLHYYIFGIYPYLAMLIFLLGSLVRYDREQFTWKSDSSQLLEPNYLRLGNVLFHIGVLGLFFGHLVGLLTPVAVWDFLGVTHSFKQLFAMGLGGMMGLCALVGILLLMYRRFTSLRVSKNSTWRDKLVLLWIFVTLLLGLSTIVVSSQHLDGEEMLSLMAWAQHIVTFRAGAAELILHAHIIFKLHLFMGMTLFVIFPFTRLVHIWSGFATLLYLGRSPQLVRTRRHLR
ncbi:respiratory nitrate reductase subunit gamma [Brackiella oedipodis]|uniref:respiratory nitrate reductase subunit gamma n=1 Tax=Brackiella oedipodis TaxID=124225 RepID=UPI00048BF855|nr:respiratory nitrate reductase subunit gamma [Brackiella oedipodis]